MKDASLKASPSLKGVVIGTNLFARAAKKKKTKSANALLPKLDEEYEEKLEKLKDAYHRKWRAAVFLREWDRSRPWE